MITVPELQANQITCCRGDRLLFENFSMSITAGQMVQIVGANGTGKTSLLRILTGLLPVTQGELLWRGLSLTKQRASYYQELFYLGHRQAIKDDLTVFENIYFDHRCRCCSAAQIHAAIEQIGLAGFNNQLCSALSQGQRQRVALAKLLLSQASIWILDEPFAALDMVGVDIIQHLLQAHLNKQGSVIFTSHLALTLASLPIQVVSLQGSTA